MTKINFSEHINKIIENHEKYGKGTLNKIFSMSHTEILDFVKNLGSSYNIPDFKNGIVYKKSRNDEPESIEIWFYYSLLIDTSGIIYRPEHAPAQRIIEFNEFFKI